ncbi:LamG-like jellyroll fold domain-containing protein [Confluentibacter lentus]|uniref:LamG-like jellyroll fold domain-containing protein n=1 Tax=Confluentibacter lentus TaxID=1699412 RepID=UPI000C281E54|nr:LamG-like jellyroll fold domain-containing protein [Confluentibacter lentus]
MEKNYSNSHYWVLLLFFGFFTIGHIQAQYCTPTNIGNFNVNYISKVKFGSIDNSSSGTTGGYNYYSSVAATDVTAGQTITGTISVTMNGWNTNTNTVAVWVNFNENADDDFEDSGERFLFTIRDNNSVGGNKTVNVPISIPIPSNTPSGASRIRIGFRTSDATNFTSCDYNWQAGDIEDYKINIISGSTDSGDIVYQPNYCVPSNRGNFNVNYISNVTFGSINNSSSGSTGGYTYYSSVAATDLLVGETINGTVSVTMNGWNTNSNTLVVWMNFNENEDDDFNDPGERFLFTVRDNRNIGGNKVVNIPISIPIPDSTPTGFTMLRVGFRTGTDTNFTACDYNYQSGEIEDYKINMASKDDDSDYFESTPPSSATLYFNGIDNYVSGDSFIDGSDDVTIMAWVKSDKGNTADMVIVGEDLACQLSLKGGNKPVFTITTTEGKEKTAGDCKNCSTINFDEWHHITGSYSSATGLIMLYVDGFLIEKKNVGKKDKPIAVSQNTNKTFEIGRFSNKQTDGQYFKGNIDEVRVFNVALSEDQIHQMVYQEIENNSDIVKGIIVKKDIQEKDTGNTVSWTNLLAYYPMTDVKDRTILDFSGYDHDLKLYNLKTIQEQTAPMPYVSANDGDWTNASTWLHGDVWDIERITNNKDWSIIKIASNVTVEGSFKTSGLIIDSEKTLTVKGDNLVENNWYLELNGKLDLLNDSQLIQTINSDLVTSANGKILRRQEGASNPFWYNYWSSPVGATIATTLSNNNGSINNANNSAFRLELLKDGNGLNMQFTNGYTANGNISTYWLYTFKNGVTYYDWGKLTKTTNISPGVGYTQKGSGIVGMQQQYIFEGKPNNGTILIDVKDKGGKGSVPSVSATTYLVGNPYPSALNISKFINDNKGIISGNLQLWQQWSGNSHNLKDYNGGYAMVNKLGSVRAYQFVGIYGATKGSQDGTLTPTKYLPVGQAFMVEIIADGKLEFNNGQRLFIKEADADKTYNNGSVFFKGTSGKSESESISESTDEVEEEFKKIRLELNSVTGPATKRELLLGFSDVTSDDFDYGYDAENTDINNNDIHLNLDGLDMNIQAYSQITNDKVVPLNFKSSGSNSFEIKITDLENIDDSQEIYLKDNFTGTYFNLKESKPYSFTSEQGKFNERFEIVFQSEEKSLDVQESKITENFIYYKNSERKLFAKKLNALVTKLAIVNMLGQTTAEFNNVSQDQLINGVNIPSMASGAYVVYFRTDTNQVFTKKIIIN